LISKFLLHDDQAINGCRGLAAWQVFRKLCCPTDGCQ